MHKDKGSKLDPKNYRPITLLSCIGKIFTSTLDDRLNEYFENFTILNENQVLDMVILQLTTCFLHMLCLNCFVYKKKKKKFTVLLSISKRRLILFIEIRYFSNLCTIT